MIKIFEMNENWEEVDNEESYNCAGNADHYTWIDVEHIDREATESENNVVNGDGPFRSRIGGVNEVEELCFRDKAEEGEGRN